MNIKKKVKKKAKKRKIPEMPCDVPHCGRPMDMGWKVLGKYYRLCFYHFKRHSNENDKFDLFNALGIEKLRVGVNVDRFGIPLPKDYDEMMERAERNKKLEKRAKRDKSISRLKNWKKNGGVSTKPKPRPKPRSVVENEMNSAVDDILGG